MPDPRPLYRLYSADQFARLDPPPQDAIRRILHCKGGEYVEWLVPVHQKEEEK